MGRIIAAHHHAITSFFLTGSLAATGPNAAFAPRHYRIPAPTVHQPLPTRNVMQLPCSDGARFSEVLRLARDRRLLTPTSSRSRTSPNSSIPPRSAAIPARHLIRCPTDRLAQPCQHVVNHVGLELVPDLRGDANAANIAHAVGATGQAIRRQSLQPRLVAPSNLHVHIARGCRRPADASTARWQA